MTTSFKVPAPVPAPAASPRSFTVEQANRMLPLVQRIVADLANDYRAWQEVMHEFEAGVAAGRTEPTDPASRALQRTARRLAADIQRYLGELAALGIECKGIEDGLVDFPSEIDGAPALLCWRLGEPSVAHWHRPDDGFAGRQPIVAPTEEEPR